MRSSMDPPARASASPPTNPPMGPPTVLSPPAAAAMGGRWRGRGVGGRAGRRVNGFAWTTMGGEGRGGRKGGRGDHFLSLDPIELTLASFETRLLKAETSAHALAASRGSHSLSFFEGCSPSLFAPSVAYAAAVDFLGADEVGALSASSKRHISRSGCTRVGEVEVEVAVEVAGVEEPAVAVGVAGVVEVVRVPSLEEGAWVAVKVELTEVEAQLAASGKVDASCSSRLLTHPSLLWHHRLGHPSLHRPRCMHSSLLVSGHLQSLPPLPSSLAPPCTPYVKEWERAAPHSSSFPPTTTPLQTLHIDHYVSGPRRERYFLLIVDDYARYTTVFPLQPKGDVDPSGPAEGGDPSADDTTTSRRPPRLEASPGFPPRSSLQPLQPVAVDNGAAPGGGDSGGARSGGADPGGAVSRGAERPSGGGVKGTTAGGSAGVLQPLPWRPLFWEQQQSSLPLPRSVVGGFGGAGAGSAGGAGDGGVVGAGAGGAGGDRAGGAGGSGAGGAGVGGTGGSDAGGAGVGGGGGSGSGEPSTAGTTPLLFPPSGVSQTKLPPHSPLLVPSCYTPLTDSLTECREPTSRPNSPVARTPRARRVRPPPVPATHTMTLRPFSVPQHLVLPLPPLSSHPGVPDPESDLARAASPTVYHGLTTLVTGPTFLSATAFALFTELVDFAATCCLDYLVSLVTDSACPPSVQGQYSSHWQIAMDEEMVSWKSTCTYVDSVHPPGANIVDGMQNFRVKRPPGSPPVFKARYLA
ncbi:unnamed protein product [Closterium sp. NIES-53]